MPGIIEKNSRAIIKLKPRDILTLGLEVVDSKTFVVGEAVQLNGNGEAIQVTDSKLIIGYVSKPNKTDEDRVVVQLNGYSVLKVNATAATAAGDPVKFEAADTASDGIPTYSIATGGQLAQGFALGAAAGDGDAFEVLLLNAPFTV